MESPQHPTTKSPSSPPFPPPPEHPLPPLLMPPPPPPLSSPSSTVTASRRLPPPCWSHEETVALIDSYREMWYTLRRGNLRAVHWEQVSDTVARRCPRAIPPKTSVQCRHKMEKLRKRYRTELQRALSIPNHRFSSSWIYFKKMDAMEKGPSSSSAAASALAVAVDSDGDFPENTNENDDNDDDDDGGEENGRNGDNGSYMLRNYDSRKSFNTRDLHGGMMNNGGGSGGGSGFRIRIQGSPSSGSGFRSKIYGKYDENPSHGFNSNKSKYNFSNPSFDEGVKYSTRVLKNDIGSGSKAASGKRVREGDEVMEMVAAINVLAEGFVKMEKMKMDMMREIEQTRMEMEMKRTEMIIESQQRILEAFAKGIFDRKKKAKGMPSPES
ncbi:hypothetical protein Ancab_037632 [Ancistrocladus abbreviatus]